MSRSPERRNVRWRPWAIGLTWIAIVIFSAPLALSEALSLAPAGEPVTTAEKQTREDSVAVAGGSVPDPARAGAPEPIGEITLDRIHEELREQVSRVRDIKARVSITQISPRDGSKSEGELQLAAIFPDLARATWTKPEIYAGVFYIIDVQANLYTEYVPATGEAHRLPLDQVLSGQSYLQLTPDQLFSLPPAERFQLDLETVTELDSASYAVVSAKEYNSDKTYRIWVDTDRWLVSRMQMLSPDGKVQAHVEVLDLEINQGLDAAALRLLPPGTVQRSYP